MKSFKVGDEVSHVAHRTLRGTVRATLPTSGTALVDWRRPKDSCWVSMNDIELAAPKQRKKP